MATSKPSQKPAKGKKVETNTQTEGKVRPAGAKPSEWQRGRPRSEQRIQRSEPAKPRKTR